MMPSALSLRHGSLRVRLLVSTLVWIILAIAVAGWMLRDLFQEHTEQQLQSQLVRQLNQLSAAVNIGPQQQVQVQPIAGDARFSTPLSGLYWQVDKLPEHGPVDLGVARSRSLWDQVLTIPNSVNTPPTDLQNFTVLHLMQAPDQQLLAVSRPLQLPDDAPRLRLTVAADQALIAEPVQRFTNMLLIALGTLAAGLALAVAVQLQLALRPLGVLRQRLRAVRSGEATQLSGEFPNELQPLVNEFNHVLSANADMVQRARTQAGNLAHAMHTPLTILSNAAAQQDSPLAQLVNEQVAIAKRQVDHQLARARAATAIRATGMRTPIEAPVQALLRTMQRLHAGHNIQFTLRGEPSDAAFRGEEQDLFEMLGNLLDNAGKWAQSRVVLSIQQQSELLCFTVEDDGPGIPEAQRQHIFERGQRLDEQRPGAGLGLDIVRDLVHTYGGSIRADRSDLGGLCMHLCLPAVQPQE